MKKFLMICLVMLLAFGLVACEKGGGGGKPQTDIFWDADQNGIEDWQEKEITLKYATWQYTNPEVETIDTLLVKEFMKKYPNITVEMQILGTDVGVGGELWEAAFLELLEADNLPDVFLINRLENILPYGILADLTSYYNNDKDTEYIFDSIKDLGLYDGKRYCIPTFIYPEVWVVNLSLLKQYKTPIPSYDWTWDQMEAIAKAVGNDPTRKTIGIYGGLAQLDQYSFELPKVLKLASENEADREAGKKWLAYGYDGNKFNFDDIAFVNAMKRLEDGLNDRDESGYGWMVTNLGQETLFDWYGSTIDPRYLGKVAIWRQPAWEFKDYMNDLQFEWDIYPGPSGVTGGNTDIAGVCQLCENKAAAYQLLKWMSFGKDGLVKRYELYEEYKTELYVSADNYPYPIVDYGINKNGVNEVWDIIPYRLTAPGFGAPEFVESLRNGAIKANKEVVGWDAAENEFKTYYTSIIMEGAKYASLKDTVNQTANAAQQLQRDVVAEQIQNMPK